MSAEGLQTLSQWVIAIGFVMAALGGLGYHHFGKKAEKARSLVFQSELLTRSDVLEEKLEPFLELARTAHPDLDQEEALESLRQDIERLREIAWKHEFTPLAPELRAAFLARVREMAPAFAEAGMSVRITLETWSAQTVKQYAAQLAALLAEGGLQVRGPEQITYFLVTPASPMEWGYNVADLAHVELLYKAVLTIIRGNEKWTKASHQERGSIRLHFGGEVNFEENGVVAVL